MTSEGLTHHALMRMAQRGFDTDDLDLIMCMGIEVEGGYLVLEKDFQAFDLVLKRARDRARRLVGTRLVVEGGCIETVYHARRTKQRRLLRHAEQRAMNGGSHA